MAEVLPGAPLAILDELVRKREGQGIYRESQTALAPLVPSSINVDHRLALALCARIADDASVRKVVNAAEAVGISVRAIQRIFREYFGVGTKWVICRCRIQEAAARVEAGDYNSREWADFALSPGYCDQSHLIREFKRLTGYSPARSLKST